MRRPLIAVAAFALAVPLLAACGSSGGTDAASTPSDTPSASATCIPKADVKLPTASAKYGSTPNIGKPVGSPPCELIVKDLKVGKGEPVTDTSQKYLWMYAGVAWSNGEIFDQSFGTTSAGVPFALNQVIPGWTEGLQGMKPGGRRLLVIPPEKGYGATGSGAIGPNETLVFVVDLIGPSDAP